MFLKHQKHIICFDIGMNHNLKHSLTIPYFLSLQKGEEKIEIDKPRFCPKALE
jgi:hypothetical protein